MGAFTSQRLAVGIMQTASRQNKRHSRSALSAATRRSWSISSSDDTGNNNNSNKNDNKNVKPQVQFTTSTVETVAVIGGGIAGLTCGKFLSTQSGGRFQTTVFDTGRLRPGGRCSSRQPQDQHKDDDTSRPSSFPLLQSTIVDHAAQILTVPASNNNNQFAEFQSQVQEWEAQGIITKYPPGTVCNIVDKSNNGNNKKGNNNENKNQNSNNQNPGGFALRPLNTPQKANMYYGTNGMGAIPQAIQRESFASLQQDVWVAPSNGVRYQKESNKWKLQAKGQTLGVFDHLVIAHNGKCADRIMSQTPAKDVHNLLRVNFAPRVPNDGGKRMTLNSIYSLSFAVPKHSKVLDSVLPDDKFVCGFVQNEPTLRFLTCQSRKYPNNKDDGSNNKDVQVWTVLSSAPFAKKFKAPQEFLPADVIQNVTSLLLQGVERSLSLPSRALEDAVLESRLQLWGAAVPVNVWDSSSSPQASQGFLHDSKHHVGVCGDWLLEPSIAGAWESGRRLAEYMISTKEEKKPIVVGVDGAFRANQQAMKAGIGSLT